MAQGGEFSSLDTEEDMLCCSVCMEEYEDPRALPCLHTFCYKCLVEISMGGGDEGGPSDVSLQVAALKLEFASYVPTSNIPKQQEVLKCPLCSEEHSIPKDKGVAGFRKDFRINKLLEQQKTTGVDALLRSISQEDVEAPPQVCPLHPSEKLMYHCETCKTDVCQECWSSTHDEHIVKLLSKKINDAKAALKKEMETSIEQISSQVGILSKTKESLAVENDAIQISIRQRFADMQQKLQNSLEHTSQEFETYKILQDKKMADEIQSLATLKDTFMQIREGLEKENLPQTSKAFNKYVNMHGKMQQMGEDLAQWNFAYTKAQLGEYVPTEEFLKAVSVTYQEETLGQKSEGGKKRGGRLKGGKKGVRQGKKEQAEKGPKQSKESKGEVGPPKSPVKMQQSEVSLKWEYFLVQKKPNIECIAATKSEYLFIATDKTFSGYKTSPPKKLFEHELHNESVDAIAMTTSKAGSVDFLVKLDTKKKVLKFLSAQGKSHPYDYVSKYHLVQKEAHKMLASSGHYVCYPYTELHKVFVAFLTVDNETPDVSEFGIPIQVPFARVRAMCMYISNKGNPVLVCSNAFHLGKTEKTDVAIAAMTKQIVHWKVTFADLDPEASTFDLRGMTCDKDNVFIINNRGNTVYQISKNGTCVSKVNIVEAPPKYHLSSPANICLDARSKSVYISHVKDIISKFSY